MKVHIDRYVGVSGARIHWMRSKDGKQHWCRRAVAIMGRYNSSDHHISTVSPFDPKFQDNYVEGKGSTKEEALDNMEKEIRAISGSMWT